MSETKQQPRQLWKPGQSGNPAGRPVGSRTKFSDAFYKDIAADWQQHGTDVLNRVRMTNPGRWRPGGLDKTTGKQIR